MAPETLLGRGYDFKVDVWALGSLYYTMITSLYVFNAKSIEELVAKVRDGSWKWPTDIKFSLQGLEFLKQTFQYNPKLRLSWDEIKRHPYLTMEAVDEIPLQILFDDSND